jgi:hypothetical protein
VSKISPTLKQSDHIDDWYVIEPYRGTGQPEGTSGDWKSILAAMKRRESEAFPRIGVRFDPCGNAMFRSPRNSADYDEATVPVEAVDSWISYAEGILRANRSDPRSEGNNT